jgi:hypothetical protein
MNRIRRIGLASLTTALMLAAAACGGSSQSPVGAKSPEAVSATSSGSADGFGAAEAAPATQGGSFDEGSPSSAPPAPPSQFRPGASADSSAAGPSRRMESEAAKPEEPSNRPGLGTEWGETRRSSITTVPFVRADFATPIMTAGLFYNDAEGARAMASASGFRRTSGGMTNMGSGLVSIGLRDERWNFLSGFVSGDSKNYVVGEAGRRYSIVIRNRTQNRLECVVSVDGLDVLDGKAASFSKRGYLVDPQGELEIDGFRQSMDTVAAFRFGSVRGSYAGQKHGDTRNVGVIGVAVFHERGTNPAPWTPEEVQRRQDANPFPGQFATPPN